MVQEKQVRLVRGLEEKLVQRQEQLRREKILRTAAKKELREVEERLKQRQHEMRGLEKDYQRMQGTHEQLWEAENKLRHKQSELELLEDAYVRLEGEVHPNRPIRIPEEPPLQRFVRQYRQAKAEKRAEATKRAQPESSSTSAESTTSSRAEPISKKQNTNTSPIPSEMEERVPKTTTTTVTTEQIKPRRDALEQQVRTEATKRPKPITSSSESTTSSVPTRGAKRPNVGQSPEHSEDMRSEVSEQPNSESSKTSRTTTTTRMSIQADSTEEPRGHVTYPSDTNMPAQVDFRGQPRQYYDYPSDTSSESAMSRSSSDAMETTQVKVELKRPSIRDVASRLLGKRRHPPTSSSSSGSTSSEYTKPPRIKQRDLRSSPLGSDTPQSDTQSETPSRTGSLSASASSTSSEHSSKEETSAYSKTTRISGNGLEI